MPLHPVALEVLRETGPMAVSSANKAGQPAAVTAEEARDQLGYSVRAYLEAGPVPGPGAEHDRRPDRRGAAAAARRARSRSRSCATWCRTSLDGRGA